MLTESRRKQQQSVEDGENANTGEEQKIVRWKEKTVSVVLGFLLGNYSIRRRCIMHMVHGPKKCDLGIRWLDLHRNCKNIKVFEC